MKVPTKVTRPQLWYCEQYNRLRILHPDGVVEMFGLTTTEPDWLQSVFTSPGNSKGVLKAFILGSRFEFIGEI